MSILRYDLFLKSPFAGSDLKQGDILAVPGAGVPIGSGEKLYLSIPKIDANAPIITPAENTKADILASLEAGVGLYPGSVPPGGNGRAVILGHSSKASWYRGKYAYIFALLPKLEKGDEFYITADRKKYVYRVFDKQVLSPADANVLLASPASGSEAVLITCYPIGSASKRQIIRAQMVRTENI